ncbi:MAG TPA: M64 family metallopeptidase [Myxococcus sp.]|nr:M64 family metallopeptidase [Myxococcus sp.]
MKATGMGFGLMLAAALYAQDASAACTAPGCTKVIDNGPDAGKLVVVVMGDGFTAAEQSAYNTQVTNMVTHGMFGNDFFREQQNAFNVYRLNLESAESGVDRITYNLNGTPNDTRDDTVTSRVNKNTALHYAYSGEWSHCWLEHTFSIFGTNMTESAKNTALSNAGLSHANYIIVLLNEPGFGGCNRGPRDIVQTLGVGWDVVAHEAGHGIGGLWDEYSVAGHYSGGAVNTRNCSTTLNRSSVFWNRYIAPATAVPTTLLAGMDSNRTVGEFEGCGTNVTGIWRPVHNCRMNGNTPDFCPVCKTLMRKSLYPNLQHTFNNAVTGDFNGDGRQDVLVHNGNDLAIYHASAAPHSLQRVWTANNVVGGGRLFYTWNIRPGDKYHVADFDGDGDDDLYVFNATDWGTVYIGMFRSNGTGLEPVVYYSGSVTGYGNLGAKDQLHVADFNGDGKKDLYLFSADSTATQYMGLLQSSGTGLSGVVRYDGCMPGWCMRAGDRYSVGDFNGDGKDDLFVFNGVNWADRWLGMIQSSGAAVQQIAAYGATLPSGWGMAANDQQLVADFDADGKDDLYVINTTDWAVAYLEMTRSTGTALQYVMRYDDDAATAWAGNIPGWTMKKGDRFFVGDSNKDGRQDLFVYNPRVDWAYEYLGALTSSGTALSGSWAEDWVGNWNLGTGDVVMPANYEGGAGKADVYIRNAEWFGLIRKASWGFTLDRLYFHWIDTPLYDSKPWSDSMP